MRTVVYTQHLELRLRVRGIPRDFPRRMLEKPDQTFVDRVEGNLIAVRRLDYNGKERNMMIAYKQKANSIAIITIHPIRDEQIIRRTISGRWIQE